MSHFSVTGKTTIITDLIRLTLDNIYVTNKYKTMQKLTLNQETEIIALIDELNQYRNGNVTSEGILEVLHETYISVLKQTI